MDSALIADAAELRRAMEYYADQGWTDGLPVVPVTESYLAEFLAQTDRDPGDVLLPMPQLNRACTVRLAAINADKSDLRQFLFDHAARSRAELAAVGKEEAVSSRTRWRLPADHPDALPVDTGDGAVRVLNSPGAVLVVVAGAGNAGVSAVVETFGPRGGPPPVTRITGRGGAPRCAYRGRA